MRSSIVALWLVLAMSPLAANSEDPRQIPLVDQDGAVFRLAGLRGEPALLTFVASRCTDACPIADALFARLSSRLAHDGLRARLVTITLDPDYDTPRIMARVAGRYRAVSNAWRFASGRPADVRRLMRALGVVTVRDARGIPDLHTTFAYILDRRVRLAGTLFLSGDLVNEAESALRRVAYGVTPIGRPGRTAPQVRPSRETSRRPRHCGCR